MDFAELIAKLTPFAVAYAILAVWVSIISIISIIVCIYDKIAAKRNPRHRTRESTLLLLSALGGSVAMFLTMQLIRHKTKHAKFMVGIPVIILLQAAIAVAVWYLI